MGFFSSRKAEQDNCITDEKSVVQVIRSKFVSHTLLLDNQLGLTVSSKKYGKPKDKDSEGSSCLPLAVSTSPPNTLPSNAKSLTLGPTSSFTPSSPHSRLRTGLKDAPVSCMPTDAITFVLYACKVHLLTIHT
jgi:hypothetical protein